MRLRLVPKETSWDFFGKATISMGLSAFLIVASIAFFLIQGLNFGIDFRGGTTIRTESAQTVVVGDYRAAIDPLGLGDITITEVFDPTFEDNQNVTMIRIQAQEGQEAVTSKVVRSIELALGALTNSLVFMEVFWVEEQGGDLYAALDAAGISGASVNDNVIVLPSGISLDEVERLEDQIKDSSSVSSIQMTYEHIKFPSVESVGPKVSGELIQTAVIAVLLAIGAVLIYIWLRFEWQFAVGAVAALVHDVILTIGIFSVLQIKFDLAIIAALLTIVGYSLNDTVVVFDRVRENLRRYKKRALQDVLNISINETLSRTVMTSVTTLLALLALFVLGGDVIRGFVFAMIWGVIVGTYSSVFVASTALLKLGVKRDWSKPDNNSGNQFANIDA